MYNEGISKVGDMIDMGIAMDIINKGGSWFTFNSERVQGREGLKKLITENPDMLVDLQKQIEAKHSQV